MRATLVLTYVGAIPAVLLWEHGRQAFWTCAIAALPLLWVLIGFHAWRRACPLAWFSRLGARLGREGARRPGARAQRLAPLIQLGLMIAALWLRHLALNGDARALAAFLLGLALLAAGVGLRWSGRTWCNVVCPVGVVERIYTEPGAAAAAEESSRCEPCGACVRRCPDLDQSRAHRAGLLDPARRLATLAWPGVVLGFYLVWLLEAGRWEAYFSGAWAHELDPLARAGAPGLAALPWLPRWAAALLVLVTCGGASALALGGLERLALAQGADPARTRHRLLTGAGTLGFAVFYLFAGQPTLRLLPAWAQALAALACASAAGAVLARGLRATPPAQVASARARRLLPVVQV